MKCEMIRDLLPLYIDGLTSEESNGEIEKHLKTCKECRACYQEMAGEMGDTVSITDEEIQDMNLIKKMKKKHKRKAAGIIAGAVLLVGIILVLLYTQMHSEVKYEDVELDYGVRGNTAYCTIQAKPGYELHFTGSSGGGNSKLKVLSIRKIGTAEEDEMTWEEEIGTKENPCRWTIEFKDKTLVFENGELVEEK